uniref:Dipeptidyl peptidase 8 n=1 Tax=Romanomermis culicivorax TaxID=13658 RepID=A0A915I2Q4_ROMCU
MDNVNESEVHEPRNLGGIHREFSSSPSSDENDLPIPVDMRKPFAIERKPFSHLIDHCRSHRLKSYRTAARTSFTNFTLTIRQSSSTTPASSSNSNGEVLRLYSIGRPSSDSTENTLLCTDVQVGEMRSEKTNDGTVNVLRWKTLLEANSNDTSTERSVPREEELLRQRLRQLIGGIGHYEFNQTHSLFLYSTNSKIYMLNDSASEEHPTVKELDLNLPGSSPMDVKFCPVNVELKSFVLNGDLYLYYNENVHRLTITGDEKLKVKTAGVASYIVQEEFDRVTGYWWCPKTNGNKYYILYEENDATSVDMISINCPAELLDNAEIMRYPRCGKKNVDWNLKIVEIRLIFDEIGRKSIEKAMLHCVFDLRNLFPWAEYMIRAGWIPDAQGVWLQLLSRLQKKLALVYVPLKLFVGSDHDITDHNLSEIIVIYEEETADFIIKDHNYLTFLETSLTNIKSGAFSFIWCHGKLGYSHLYLIKSTLPPKNGQPYCQVSMCQSSEVALTHGEFEVCRKAEPHVDKLRGLVYFLANRESWIESQLYCIDYLHPAMNAHCLTSPGFSYGFHRDAKAFLVWEYENRPWSVLVIPRTNFSTPYQTTIHRISHSEHNGLPHAELMFVVASKEQVIDVHLLTNTSIESDSEEVKKHEEYPPEVFSWRCQNNRLFYGCLLRPNHFDPDCVYPVILYVYGGPEVQLVRNVYTGSMNLTKLTSLGFAVVFIDGRGSSNRGMPFEQDMWGNMGSVELEDQIEGLKHISSHSKCLDLNRLAIMGWSYGGYLALMGLAKHGEYFRAAVAGAPVANWELYDTGYTERYMGMPDANVDGYYKSSVLTHVKNFPDEPGRLLLLHGLVDENVHFSHTSAIIGALIKAGKPYQLQIYPTERHAMCNFDAGVHMEATVLDFFVHVLGTVIIVQR